jgi:hypothetical protein
VKKRNHPIAPRLNSEVSRFKRYKNCFFPCRGTKNQTVRIIVNAAKTCPRSSRSNHIMILLKSTYFLENFTFHNLPTACSFFTQGKSSFFSIFFTFVPKSEIRDTQKPVKNGRKVRVDIDRDLGAIVSAMTFACGSWWLLFPIRPSGLPLHLSHKPPPGCRGVGWCRWVGMVVVCRQHDTSLWKNLLRILCRTLKQYSHSH